MPDCSASLDMRYCAGILVESADTLHKYGMVLRQSVRMPWTSIDFHRQGGIHHERDNDPERGEAAGPFDVEPARGRLQKQRNVS